MTDALDDRPRASRSVSADYVDVPDFGSRTSLRQQVTEVLRGAVITGAMRPGALYSAPALATRFGISATPVREAMLDLVKEGLIETVRNKGFRVTALTDQELDDITEIRMLIEVPTTATRPAPGALRQGRSARRPQSL